jgi:hypothetical protein
MQRLLPVLGVCLLLACTLVSQTSAFGWGKVDAVLRNGITTHTTPGLQALVADHTVCHFHVWIQSITRSQLQVGQIGTFMHHPQFADISFCFFQGIIYHKTFGNYTYGLHTPLNHANPPVTFSVCFVWTSKDPLFSSVG